MLNSRSPECAWEDLWTRSGNKYSRGDVHEEGYCGTKKTAGARNVHGRIYGRGAGINTPGVMCTRRATAELKKQQEPGTCMGGFMDAERE